MFSKVLCYFVLEPGQDSELFFFFVCVFWYLTWVVIWTWYRKCHSLMNSHLLLLIGVIIAMTCLITTVLLDLFFFAGLQAGSNSTQWGLFSSADSRFAPSQWETALLCNDVFHWLGVSLESALVFTCYVILYNIAVDETTKSLTKLDVCTFHYYFKSLTAVSNHGSSSQNQVDLGEWATGHFMHWHCICAILYILHSEFCYHLLYMYFFFKIPTNDTKAPIWECEVVF